VRRLKFDRDTGAGLVLVLGMVAALGRDLPMPLESLILVPVPADRGRRQQRGFDQSEWLAGRLAQRLGLHCPLGCLQRIRTTLPQGDPRVVSRQRNVAGAFAVRIGDRRLAGARVLLVDDVVTTGATARECARAARRGGAKSVALVTACRAREP
jgi:predicted amidophosphoribosyltransferase